MSLNVLNILSGDLWGGSEAQMGMQIAALQVAGVDANVLLFNSLDTRRRFEQSGIKCHVVDEGAGFLRLLSGALSHAAALKPQIVVAHGYKELLVACAIAVRCRIPLIITFHGKTENYRGLARAKITAYLLLRRVLVFLFAKRIVVISKTLAHELGYGGSLILRIVPNVARQTEHTKHRRGSEVSRKRRIAIVGRLVPVKRIDLAITALAKLLKQDMWKDKVELLVVGDGPERENLERLSRALKVSNSVVFTGFRDDASGLLAESDLLLLTSDSEGVPTVLLEAVDAGVPVVSRNLGGVREVLETIGNYPAAICESNSPLEFAEAIATMLQLDAEVDIARVKEKLKQHFSPEASAKLLITVYSEVLSK